MASPAESSQPGYSAEPDNHRHAGTILKMIRNSVAMKLDHLFTGLADNVADALFEEMIGMEEETAMASHFNVMRALRQQQAACQDDFMQILSRSWVAMLRAEPLPAERPGGRAGEAVALFEPKVRNHYKVLIQDVRLRLSTLLGREVKHFPLEPVLLHAMFWEASAKLDLDDDERLLLIPLFHRFVMDRYGQVLAIVNRLLIEHDIEPLARD